MNYDPRFAAVCGDARLPSYRTGRLIERKPQAVEKDPSEGWDAQRLRHFLASKLSNDQIIVVSNRQPFSHDVVNGKVTLMQPASGLVTALEPLVRALSGTWIAHGSGVADADFVDAADGWEVPVEHGSYRLRRIWMTQEEREGFYDGFSNSALWPLCHRVHVKPTFLESDWQFYEAVNHRFANAVVREARGQDPIVLVQDYQLALVPALVRAQLPLATVVTFWHIPWAHPQQMEMCPWMGQLVQGLLGSDVVGFQTTQDARNFSDLAARIDGPTIHSDSTEIFHDNHRTKVRTYPISIAWPTTEERYVTPTVKSCRLAAEKQWSIPKGGRLIIGVDRFDYTKGILERLQAFEELLTNRPPWQGVVRFVQVAVPTRTGLNEYKAFQQQVHAEVKRINAKFAVAGDDPIVLLDWHHDRAALDKLYRAADVCLVTSLHDGMNLVCKEFVAARDDEYGVLVLSQFAGAVDELSDALVVNPYHTAQVAESLHLALTMPKAEQRQRMQALRSIVKSANVYRWAASMLMDAAALRSNPGSTMAKSPRNFTSKTEIEVEIENLQNITVEA